ncbi:hypothetical protein AB0H88_13580 [Nonomuraea sp. NPDC050680]|uniref:hypothetical protein n=1 Tax=Nonomuraea sp. NPDC050680 TaxID=3154630 RepID=UPI0033D418DE
MTGDLMRMPRERRPDSLAQARESLTEAAVVSAEAREQWEAAAETCREPTSSMH